MSSALRDLTRQLIDVLDEAGDDLGPRDDELVEATKKILSLPGLDTAVANPAWSGSTEEGAATGWLYQDGDVRIVRGTLPAGFTLPPHNHGGWNIFGIYRGAVHYRSYRRLDDRSRPHVADLEVAEDRVMVDGDVTLLPAPPDDIHAVTALAAVTTSLLVARGPFDAVREQYLPDCRAYYEVPAEEAAR